MFCWCLNVKIYIYRPSVPSCPSRNRRRRSLSVRPSRRPSCRPSRRCPVVFRPLSFCPVVSRRRRRRHPVRPSVPSSVPKSVLSSVLSSSVIRPSQRRSNYYLQDVA